jgi:hypothetical protein
MYSESNTSNKSHEPTRRHPTPLGYTDDTGPVMTVDV